MPRLPVACGATASADVFNFKQSDIANFNLNFDVSDTELEEVQEQDTSVGLFD